ncbi:MAG: trigger factor [Enterobacteriaceae bacterium]|nr:trigger factor [Enterobacteriaceae bacterium]
MKINLEKIKHLTQKLTIEIPKSKVIVENEKKIIELSNSIKIDGFRKGMVPINIIFKRFGKEIHNEIIYKLLNESIKNIILEKKLKIIDQPILKSIVDNDVENLKFVLEFEIFPDIILNLEDITIKKYISEISKEDVNTKIYEYRKLYGIWKETIDKSIIGDLITIDTIGKKNNITIEKYTCNNIEIELDKKNTIFTGIEEVLIGKNTGEIVDFYIEPINIKNINTSKEKVEIKILIKKITRNNISEINIEFAKKIGISDGDINKIDEHIIKKLDTTLNLIEAKLLKDNIIKELLLKHNFEIPEALILKERSQFPNDSENKIIENIKLKLLLNKLKIDLDINVSEKELENRVNLLNIDNVIDDSYKKLILKNIENNIYIEKIINIIKNKINIIEEFVSFEKLLKTGNLK